MITVGSMSVEDVKIVPPSASRCPECGRRVTDVCPSHGPVRPDRIDSDLSLPAMPPPSSFAGYSVIGLLAEGGFGLVFAAEPVGGGRHVAIKLARDERPGARRRLAEEQRVLAEIGPPYVPALLDHGETAAGAPYLIMELLHGLTLADRIADLAEPLPLLAAIDHTTAILRALAVVHERGYVHCDLKPENIVIGEQCATLIDFGLAIRAGGASWAADTTGEVPVAGTSEYMSPEQCEGRPDIDARADIYAIGVILQELITGRPPFWGPRAVVREMHVGHRPPRLSAMAPEQAVPLVIEDIVACCLAKDRNERFSSVQALQRALDASRAAVMADDAPAAPSSRAASDSRRDSRRLTAAIVFFTTDAEPVAVQSRLRTLDGQIGHAAGGRYAAVFALDHSENPARRALVAAEELVRAGVCSHARVDLAPVAVQMRKGGARRFVSAHFARAERYPAPDDPPVFITDAAAAVLPDEASGAHPSRPEPGREATTDGFGEIPPVFSSPLFGREEIIDSLVRGAREVSAGGPPAIVTVTGEPGAGKSHLFHELARRLAELGPAASLVTLRVPEPRPGDTDGGLFELLRSALDMPAFEGDTTTGSPDRAMLLSFLLGQSLPAASRGDLPLRSLGAAPFALRSAITAATGEALRRKAAERPLLVLLDDAHLAGDVALAALEYAAAAEAGARIWVCALGRPSLAADHPTWGERAAVRRSESIGPLDPASAAALCRSLLLPVEAPPDAAVQHLVARAHATPLLLVELVRGLRRDGIVRRSPKGDDWYLATGELDRLPDLPLIEWLAHRELDGLAPALRGHAHLLALLGDGVTDAEIRGVVRWIDEQGGDEQLPLDARVGTRRLLSAGVIVRDAEGRFSYRHALVREAVQRSAPEEFRRRVHLAAACYYRYAESSTDHRRIAHLAMHASAAGLTEEAARAYFVLAERARAWHAYVDAERLYSRVLEQAGLAETDRGPAHRGRGLMRYRLARYHDALADFSVARAVAEADGDVTACIDILLDEATALDWMHDYAASAIRVREAEARMPPHAPPLLHARLLLGLGRSATRWNRNDEAARLLERAIAAAEPLGDDGYETRMIALLLTAESREADALAALDRAVALAEQHGDLLHLGAALNNRALLLGRRGDKERMVADAERGLTIARELGQGSLELMLEFNLGELLLQMDDAEAAAPHVARALSLDLRINGHPGRAPVALLEARLRLHLGDIESAAAIVGSIRAQQEEAHAAGDLDTLMVPSDEVLCAAVELSVTSGTDEQWDALEARSAEVSVGQERIEVIELRAAGAQRTERIQEARAHLERALALAKVIPNAMGLRLARRKAVLDS